jgi:hypothetical protein
MRKIFCAFAIIALFSSCAFDVAGDIYFSETYKDTPLYYGDFREIKKKSDIAAFIRSRVTYQSDFVDEKSSPRETLSRGCGDCEDFAILYLNILYVVFREKGELVLVNSGDARSVESGGIADHAIVRLSDGQLLEPQSGQTVEYACVRYSYTFDQVF